MSWRTPFLFVLFTTLVVAGCGDDGGGTDASTDSASEAETMAPIIRCGSGDDVDGDNISGMDEGEVDTDGDGTPNSRDEDSDNDGVSDRDEAGDEDCSTAPVDTDGDGTPDYLDTDSNDDGESDGAPNGSMDSDGDGIPDRLEADIDNDGVLNRDELGEDGAPIDTDGDGIPDFRDMDSDGDSISDLTEGLGDPDSDGIPNLRDSDSDGDTIPDATEAGDASLETDPTSCALEIDNSGMTRSDNIPDYLDIDSDGDGLGDRDEVAVGSDPCALDTDGDGFNDLAEGAYVKVNCPDGVGQFCDCANNASCSIPDDDFYIILPYLGEPEQRDLDFNTAIRVADIFFLTDTTGSMGSTLTNVKDTVARAGTGLMDRINETIPDAWFGGGQHDDFPFGGYGSAGRDEAFKLAIQMTPPTIPGMSEGSGRMAVGTAFRAIELHSGADGPESHTEGLYQVITGEGGTWRHGSTNYMLPAYVGRCLDGGYGAPCFRGGALPMVVHFSDICAHEGPPGEDLDICDPYTGVTPSPHTWTEMMAEFNRVGAKYIGVNTTSSTCVGVVAGGGRSPCYFMKRTAEESNSVDIDGNALVYDLPNASGDAVFTDTIVEAIETVATRVPLDVDTGLRDDPSDALDATRFIKRRQPACRAQPPTDPCWTAPEGYTQEEAIAAVDESTFFGVIPGAQVKFRITFQNDFYVGGPRVEVYIAYIDVRGGGTAILDTRLVILVVPANQMGIE